MVSLGRSSAASLEGGGKYGKRGSGFLRPLRKMGLLWVATTWVSGYVERRKEGSWTQQGLAVVTVPGDSTFGSGLVPALGTFLCPSLQPPPAVSLSVTSAPLRVPHGRPLIGLSVTCGLQRASFCLLILGGPGVCVLDQLAFHARPQSFLPGMWGSWCNYVVLCAQHVLCNTKKAILVEGFSQIN